MSERAAHHTTRSRRVQRIALALLLLLVVGVPSPGGAAQAAHANSAGLVIRHGDGSVLYFLVQFSEAQISGTQLLERAGVSIDVTPYAGIGEAICRIDGEGCPATDCFCKSFANPAVYWRYHKLGPDGNWVFLPSGPDAREVHNGDIDGWSWSSKDGELPPVTLAQIAQITGVTLAASPTADATSVSTATTTAARATKPVLTTSASPIVVGAEVKPSGQVTSVAVSPRKAHRSNTPYIWFGAAVLTLVVVAVAVLLRGRRVGT